MNINHLLKEKEIEVIFTEGINEKIKEEILQGEIITNKTPFLSNLLLKNGVKTFYSIENPSLKTVSLIKKRIKKDKIIGIGGGRALDVAKKVASDLHLPLISVPTAPSHDGLISKNSSLYTKKGKRETFPTTYPQKIFIPLSLWKNSGNLKKAGFCDIISNIIALEDISLAEKYGEKFKQNYKVLSEKSIKKATLSDERKLAIALIYSGLAMEETSRYCSGSEHDVERLLESEMKKYRFLHGQLAGTGTLISAKVYSIYYKILPSGLKFNPKTLYRRVLFKIKRNHLLTFVTTPLRVPFFNHLWLKNLSGVRPERFNLWNVIDSRSINWKKIISEILNQK